MSNITFKSFEDETKAAISGLASQNFAGKTVKLELVSPWEKKDEKGVSYNRTKLGKGSLGVNTTAGWLNASELIAHLGTLDDKKDKARIALIKPGKNKELELVVGTAQSINITFDDKGKIAKVELA